jgi:purine-binding chemotaxis protein CheW
MNLRGRVIAVVDLAALVGLPAQRLEPAAGHVLILDRGKRALGFLIGAVLGVETIAPPADAPGGLVRGVVPATGGAVTLLGPDALTGEADRLFGAR